MVCLRRALRDARRAFLGLVHRDFVVVTPFWRGLHFSGPLAAVFDTIRNPFLHGRLTENNEGGVRQNFPIDTAQLSCPFTLIAGETTDGTNSVGHVKTPYLRAHVATLTSDFQRRNGRFVPIYAGGNIF